MDAKAGNGCDKRGGGSGWGSNAEAEMVCAKLVKSGKSLGSR